MTNVLETNIQYENQAASGRFFISSEHRPTELVKKLIDNFDAISAESVMAKEQLQTVTDEQYADYTKKIGELSAGKASAEAVEVVGFMQSLLDRAGCYQDAVSAIRGAGTRLAGHLRGNLPTGFQRINENYYWVIGDCRGKAQLCGETSDGEGIVVFGMLAFPDREEGREANTEDYIRLINDVEVAAA